MDNNESFSSLWHAANLHRFGFRSAFGLTDEAYGSSPAAHPYVYTHQGNFPRLFAYAIYVLGAKSIELQIVVTTFTVGVAGTLLAYALFARLMTPLFATLACAVMVTDYLLVAQWQVVTIACGIRCSFLPPPNAFMLARKSWRRWRLSTIVTFAALYYFEFVFVAFVSLATALYAVFVLRSYKRALEFVIFVSIGAAFALSVLFLQLVLYLGFKDTLRDAYFTFVARNQYLTNPHLVAAMKEFFDSRGIVFWYNLQDGSQYKSLKHLVASITIFEFQVHTPLFTAVKAIILSGLSVGALSWWFADRRSGPVARAVRAFWQGSWYLVAAAFLFSVGHYALNLARGEFGIVRSSRSAVSSALRRFGRSTAAAASAREERRFSSSGAGLATGLLLALLPALLSHSSNSIWLIGEFSPLYALLLLVYLAILALAVASAAEDALWTVVWQSPRLGGLSLVYC